MGAFGKLNNLTVEELREEFEESVKQIDSMENSRHIKGDLLDLPNGINVIGHQANTETVMSAGFAKVLRKKWPEVYDADFDFHIPKGEDRLGQFSVAHVPLDDPEKYVYVFNLYGQRLNKMSPTGIPTNYHALTQALMGMEKFVSYMRDTQDDFNPVIGFPYMMGCGLGGGDWGLVSNVIEAVFSKSGIPFYYVEKE